MESVSVADKLEDLHFDVAGSYRLCEIDCPAGAEEDVVLIDPTQGELNINQFIYDYVCLSLPIVKVHPEGKCNPDVEKYLSGDGSAEGPAADTPFSNLEEILKDKNN